MTYLHLSISYLTIQENLGRSWGTEFYKPIHVFQTAANKHSLFLVITYYVYITIRCHSWLLE